MPKVSVVQLSSKKVSNDSDMSSPNELCDLRNVELGRVGKGVICEETGNVLWFQTRYATAYHAFKVNLEMKIQTKESVKKL